MLDIVLMGASKAGRTSMAKVIFQKMVTKQTQLLSETTKVQSYDFRIQKIDFKLYDFPAYYDISDPPPNQQMILKNASALIFVLNPQAQPLDSLDDFHKIHQYIKKKNSNSCSIFLFTNKSDIELNQQDARNEYLLKIKKRINDDGIDTKEIDFHFTSIFDYSVFQAFSRVMQKMIPCSPYIGKMLTNFSNNSKVQKVYVFDLITKLYIATNDQKIAQPIRYEVCSQILDIYIDISYLYGGNQKTSKQSQNPKQSFSNANKSFSQQGNPQEDSTAEKNKATIKLNIDEGNEFIVLKSVEKYLALVFIIKDSNYDRPYMIEQNITVLKDGLAKLLNATIAALR